MILSSNIRQSRCTIKETLIVLASVEIFLELFVNRGYVFQYSSFQANYSFIFQMIIVAFVIMFKVDVLAFKKTALTFFVFLVISLWLKGLFYFNEYLFYFYLRLIISFFMFIAYTSIFDEADFIRIVSLLTKMVLFILFPLIIIEFITKNIFDSNAFNIYCDYVLGVRASTSNFLFLRNGLYALQGLNTEPAILVTGLYCSTILYLYFNL